MELARWGTSASKGPWVAVRASVGTVVLAALPSSAEVTRSPSPERRGEPEAAQPYQQPWLDVKHGGELCGGELCTRRVLERGDARAGGEAGAAGSPAVTRGA